MARSPTISSAAASTSRAIDGETVGPGSAIAREVASELSSLDPNIRPNEIGSPWAISGPGYFTDAAHQNHLHLGFKQEITAGLEAARGRRGGGRAAAPGTPVAAAAAVPRAAAPPRARHRASRSQLFLKAVTAEAAEAASKKKPSESQLFLKAVEAPKPRGGRRRRAGRPGRRARRSGRCRRRCRRARRAAPDAYPGDNAPREQIAAWMAGQAQKRGLPPQLPLMASLVESGMKNLNFGDADSVGFFQMRVGIWNQGAYAGYPEKPELQVKWFLDQAEAVKKQRIVAGKPIDDPNSFGEWIADVERPAEQYRGRYQTKLEEANQLLASAPSAAAAAPGGRRCRSIRPRRRRARPRSATRSSRPEILGAGPGRDRGRQRARPEGAGRDRGGLQVHRHRLQVGRLDAADRLRLLRADAVVLRAVRRPDPARHVHADRGAERHRGRGPRRASSPATWCSSPTPATSTTSACTSATRSSCTRRSTGDVVKVSSLDEPYYAGQFAGGRRFDEARRRRRRRAAPAVAAGRPGCAPAVDPTEVAQGAGRRRARRRRGPPPGLRAVPGGQGRGGDQGERAAPVGAVPEGGRPVAGQAPRGAGRGRVASPPRSRRPRPPAARGAPAAPAAPGRGRRRRVDRPHERRHRLPGRQRLPGGAREVAGQAGREGRASRPSCR